MSKTLPKIAFPHSIKVDVNEGDVLYYCTCGLSQKQPFCDNSHVGTEFKPLKYIANETKKVSFCGCKLTQKPPFCDGQHKNIKHES